MDFSGVAVVALCGLLTLAFLYLFLRPKSVLARLPSAPESHWLLGHLPNVIYLDRIMQGAAKIAPLTTINFLAEFAVVVSDPALCRKVFQNSSQRDKENPQALYNAEDVFSLKTEDKWRPERRRLNPFFTTSAVKDMFPCIKESAQETVRRLLEASDKDFVIADEVISRAVMDSLVRCIFSRKFDEDTDNQRRKAIQLINDNQWADLIELIPLLKLVWNPYRKHFLQGLQTMLKLSEMELERRREEIKSGKDVPKDLLTNLLLGKSEDPNDPEPTQKQNVDHTIAFFFAGQDTTTNSLLFTIYCLCHNPDVMKKAVAEVDDVMSSWDGESNFVNDLHYLDKVLKEGLRMFPVAVGTSRVVHGNLDLDGTILPDQTFVLINATGMHKLPRYWEKPQEFYPEHFNEDAVAARDPGVYLPFGGGARACIGFKMALLEQRLLLAFILRYFTLELKPNQNPVVVTGLTTHFDKELYVRFTPRNVE